MPEQALYLKWRPMTFEDVVGQEHITRTLRNSLKTGRIRHAYLFSGPRGTGKTTTARLLAKAVNCKNENYDIRPCNICEACLAVNEGRYLDLIEIDAATHTGVDDVRELRDKIAFTPSEGRYKVYIIDEVHRFSGSAFDALLKTLEEPPEHAIFVLATTEIDRVPQTIKSRCLQFEFRRVSLQQVADRLEQIVKGEGLRVERAALELIARQGTGSLRDSISLLDQIVSDPQDLITLDLAQRILGTANIRAVRDLVDALADANVARGLHIINEAVDMGSDPKQLGQQIVEHLRAVLLTQTAGPELVEASDEDRALYVSQARRIPRRTLLRAVQQFNAAVNDYRGGWQPQLALELALIESVKPAEEPQQVIVMPQAAPSVAASAEPHAVESGPPVTSSGPAVIALERVLERWKNVLGALRPQQSSVMMYFKPTRVDGSVITLSTDNRLYFDRMSDPKKIDIVSQAVSKVYGLRLRVRLELMESDASQDRAIDDPLLNIGRELGARVRDIDES